jgi:uncharacterized protein (TIGR03083 family)
MIGGPGGGRLRRMDLLQVIEDESAAFLGAARQGLDVAVPSCPGWDVRALVAHLGRVQRFHGAHVVRGETGKPDGPVPETPQDDAALLPWFEEGAALLLDALRRTDPTAPAWTWAPHVEPVAAFWTRRMAHEVAVHRWDAQDAHGTPEEVAPELAADGVDEVLRVHRPADWDDEPVTVRGVVAVRLTDTGQEQVLQVAPDGLTMTDAPPEAVLSGRAHEVLLALWGRAPLEPLVAGDLALVQALRTG